MLPRPRILSAAALIAVMALAWPGHARSPDAARQHALEHLLIGPELPDPAANAGSPRPARPQKAMPRSLSDPSWSDADRRRYERRFAALPSRGRRDGHATVGGALHDRLVWAARREQQGRRDIEALRAWRPRPRF